MILRVIQCDHCSRYLASGIDKLSKDWSRRRYFDVDDLDLADTYTTDAEVITAMIDGKYTCHETEGIRCPGCQKELEQ